MAEKRRVRPYEDSQQTRTVIDDTRTYEYEHPFNYPNVEVDRSEHTGEQHGLELMPIPEIQSGRPADAITVTEAEPITEVTVIGSACTPPGYVQLEADPIEGFRREQEIDENLPVRFREEGLWGTHVRGDQRNSGLSYEEYPLAGMSCATFEVPRSETVRVTGGSQTPGWSEDTYPDDFHYSFRVIRTTVVAGP